MASAVYVDSLPAILRILSQPFGMQARIEPAPKEPDGSDMVAVIKQYVGFGDMVVANMVAAKMVAAHEVSRMPARRAHPVRVMLARSVPFANLRHPQPY